MKIIQITDLHIGKPGRLVHGIDVREHLLRVLTRVEAHQPDLVAVTGDLCLMRGKTKIYRWIKAQFDRLEIPVKVIPGNHDSAKKMAKVFGMENLLHDGELYYRTDDGLIFLDTGKGSMSGTQLDWLQSLIEENPNTPKNIFMHYPPALAGSKYMDSKYPLRQTKRIQEILHQNKTHVSIFCGHYHIAKTVHVENIAVFITPATLYEIDQYSAEFKIGHTIPGYRTIELNDESLITKVHYARKTKPE